jgi:uncharacterized membrane protein YesL
MFGFAIKKAFFDLWDHLYFALAVNLVFTVVTLGSVSLAILLAPMLSMGVLFLVPVPFLLASLLGGIATFWAKDIVVEGQAKFGSFVAHLKSSWKPSLAFGLAWLILAAGIGVGVPFYTAVNSTIGFAFGVVMAWLAFFAAGMGLFYPGLNAQVEPQIRKLVKKSFLVFVANPLTSFWMILVLLVSVVLTVVTAGFFPGILGISIWLQVCFKFVLAKYDWLEANPEANAKKVPWATIVAEDMEKVGPRSLRSLIFPWKD